MGLWNLPLSNPKRLLADGTVIGFGWQLQVKGASFAHGVTFGGNLPTPSEEKAIFWRALCHYFVDITPDEGLEDLAESAVDLLNFYFEPFAKASLPPTKSEVVEAKVQSTYERPVLDIAEE
jgi:hypothetical protein